MTDPITARGPLTLADLLRVAEDVALQEGRQRFAAILRNIANVLACTTPGEDMRMGHWLTPDEVLARCGYDPAVKPTDGRRSGRTTRMLAEAVSAMSMGVLPRLIGANQRQTRTPYNDLFKLARQCGLDREFVDHYANEVRRLPAHLTDSLMYGWENMPNPFLNPRR